MKRFLTVMIICAAMLGSVATGLAGNSNRLGIGANYWKTIRDLDLHDIHKNGFSWLLTYQYAPGCPLSLEADLEYFNRGFAGTSEDVFAPQAFIVLGTSLYGALGIGTYYSDSEFASDPFYAFRLGFDFHIFRSIYMDINVNYRFNEWTNIHDMADDINSDTITIGTAVRMEF